MRTLADSGVGRLFGPGSSTQDIAIYIREWFKSATGDDPFVAPAPLEPARLPSSGGPVPAPARDAHHARAAKKKPAKKKTAKRAASSVRRNGKAAKPAKRRAPAAKRAAKKVARRKPARRR
jgi:hypothetical protein